MNEQYLNQTIRRIVYLESLKQSEINKLAPHIKAIDKSIKKHLIGDELTELTLTNFKTVLADIKQNINEQLVSYTEGVSKSLTDIATDGYL